MGNYKLLFSVSFTHQYFRDKGFNVCVEPSGDLQRFIANTGLLLQRKSDGILLYYDDTMVETLLAYQKDNPDGVVFDFIAYTPDPAFYNYTKLPETMSLMVFENTVLQSKNDITVLQPSANPIEKSLYNSGNSAVSICAVRISANAGPGLFDKNGEITPRAFSIHFESRETYWKYLIKKEHSVKDVIIEDYKQKITFSKKDDAYHVAGVVYQVVMSDNPLPLVLKSENIFQLKEKNGNKCRVLMKRLPAASPAVVHKGKKGKQDIQVSEIFINH